MRSRSLLAFILFSLTTACARAAVIPRASKPKCTYKLPDKVVYPNNTRLISAADPDCDYGTGSPYISPNDFCTVWNWQLQANLWSPSSRSMCALMLAMPQPGRDNYTFDGPGNFKIVDYVNASITASYTYTTQPQLRNGGAPNNITVSPGTVYTILNVTCNKFAPQGTASGRVCSSDTYFIFTQTGKSENDSGQCPQGFFIAVT